MLHFPILKNFVQNVLTGKEFMSISATFLTVTSCQLLGINELRGPSNRLNFAHAYFSRNPSNELHGIFQTDRTSFCCGGQENVTVHVESDFGLTLADNVFVGQ